MTDKRERRLELLMQATGENTKSGALDAAAEFYLHMAAVDAGQRVGAFAELLSAAEDRGSLTGSEIATILDSHTVEVDFQTEWKVE